MIDVGGVCEFSTEPERLAEGIFLLRIPFDGNIYTSSYILLGENGTAVLDSGSCGGDAEEYIIPFLEKLGRAPDHVICSHLHEDHCGGTSALLTRYPSAKAVLFNEENPYPAERVTLAKDGDVLLERYRLKNLPGHTPDALAVLDEGTKMLLSCDCLQQYGITRFPTGVSDVTAYMGTLETVRALSVKTIVAAHNYVPLGYRADGAEEIERMLTVCAEAAVGNFLKNI